MIHFVSSMQGNDISKKEKDNSSTPLPRLTYARRDFDPRRICGSCTEELRGAIISSGHDLELWHTVDHERRALLMGQRQNDIFKAKWAERERGDRQVRFHILFVLYKPYHDYNWREVNPMLL